MSSTWNISCANIVDGSDEECFALPLILELSLLNVSINKKPDNSLLIGKRENRKLFCNNDYWEKHCMDAKAGCKEVPKIL